MRKVVICVAGLVIVGMLMYPPWVRQVENLRTSFPYGYHWLWDRPDHSVHTTEMVDYGRLGLQVGAVAVVAGVLLVMLPRKKA